MRSWPVVLVFLLAVSWAAADDAPRVFVTDSHSWEFGGGVAGSRDGFGGGSRGGARPQTAEIIKTFHQRCRNVIINNRRDKADYLVLLDHEGGKSAVNRDNKVVVFNPEGDAIFSQSTRSLGNSVKNACSAIMKDWFRDRRTTSEARGGNGEPAGARVATVRVLSQPEGADIELDGRFVGSTPSRIELEPGEYTVRVTKAGYAAWERRLRISGGEVRLLAELQSE